MKSPLKIIIVVVLIITSLLGGALFVASKKLNPEDLKMMMVTQIETALPNSIVTTKALDFSLGLTSTVDLSKVDIAYKGKRKYPMFSVDTVKLKIPIWSILFGGGKIELVIDEPKVNYIEFKKGSNWQRAIGKSNKKSNKAEEGGEASFPAVIAGSELNVSINNLLLDYSLRDSSSGKVVVKKLLLKDVGIRSMTAFEIQSSVDLLKKTPNHTVVDILLIGETKLMDWIEKDFVSIKSKLTISNLKNNFLKRDLKKLLINSTTQYHKNGKYNISLNSFLEEKDFLTANIKSAKKGININDINLRLNLKEIFDLVKVDNLPINLNGKEEIVAKGSLYYGSKMIPNLTVSSNQPIEVVSDGINLKTSLTAKLSKDSLSAKLVNDIFGGKVKIDAFQKTNWNFENLNKMKPLNASVIIQDVVIPSSFYEMKESAQASNAESKSNTSKAETKKSLTPIPMNAKISINNLDVGGAKYNGAIKANVSSRKVTINAKNFEIDKGSLSFSSATRLNKGKLSTEMDLGIKQINLSSFKAMLPKNTLKGISGVTTGKVKGNTSGENYNFDINVNLLSGKLTKINLKQYIGGLLDKLGSLKKKVDSKEIAVNGEFKSLALIGKMTQSRHQFKRIKFVDRKGDFSLTGSGNVYLKRKDKSKLNLNLVVNKKKTADKLKAQVGTSTLPMLLVGTGYALNADYGYTTKKVAKSAAKTQGKKVIKKQLNKLLKGKNEKKLKGLMKGLFK